MKGTDAATRCYFREARVAEMLIIQQKNRPEDLITKVIIRRRNHLRWAGSESFASTTSTVGIRRPEDAIRICPVSPTSERGRELSAVEDPFGAGARKELGEPL